MAATDGVLPERVSFSAQEERVLALWKSLDAFGTSLRLSADKPLFTFFDGPPFATVRRAAAQPRRALCACRRH
jgi:isoleucyl-tRNA synthetase